jgi:hypothetical protein
MWRLGTENLGGRIGPPPVEILATHLRSSPDPASGVQRTDLAELLRPGRVLAGVVLEINGREALLGLGQHRVTALAPSGLAVGQQLVLRAGPESGTQGVLLDVLGAAGGQEPGLLRMLRAVVGLDRPIGELLEEIGKRLAAERSGTTGATTNATGLLEKLGAHVFRPGADGAELRQLLATNGLAFEAGVLDAARNAATRDEARALLLDLKAQLLNQLAELPAGSLRDAVSRALSGLEAEQLLNVARRDAGEPLHWSFPLPDGDHWTTAHLLWTRQRDAGDSDDGTGREETQRVAIGVQFSNTGPVRIDAFLRPGALNVRLLVERADVAERIRADVEVLTEALASTERTVQIAVGVAPPETVEIEARSMDIRYLRKHHLMDVSG